METTQETLEQAEAWAERNAAIIINDNDFLEGFNELDVYAKCYGIFWFACVINNTNAANRAAKVLETIRYNEHQAKRTA